MWAEDPEGARDRDQEAGEALGRDLEQDRDPAEGERQDLVNSFQLEVLHTTSGCLSSDLCGIYVRLNTLRKMSG